ncbi:hypothetical protein Tco_1203926 [Tanacetum coccineum]
MADLTLNIYVPKRTKPTSVNVSPTYVIKKNIENKPPGVPDSTFDKKADSSTEQLLLTLMEEVNGLKRQIDISLGTSPSNSQSSSSKTKQKSWFGPYKQYGLRNHLFDDCYLKPKCSTCGSTDHLTKKHSEHAAIKKTLIKLKAQLPLNLTPKKAPRIQKPFSDCTYCGFNNHHSDDCEYYHGCKIYGSIAHEIAECPKKYLNSRIYNTQNLYKPLL